MFIMENISKNEYRTSVAMAMVFFSKKKRNVFFICNLNFYKKECIDAHAVYE